MPSYESVYNAVISHIFKQYIFGWIGSDRDIYVLQGMLDEPFESFHTTDILEVMNDSDEKWFLKGSNAAYGRENDFDDERYFEFS